MSVVPKAVWSSSVREEERHLMRRHRHQRDEVPEHVRVLKILLNITVQILRNITVQIIRNTTVQILRNVQFKYYAK